MVQIFLHFITLISFYWTGSLQNLSCSFLCTVLKPDLQAATSVWMGRLVFLWGPPSPPHPCTCQWPLSLKLPAKPSFSIMVSSLESEFLTLSLTPYSCHHIRAQNCCLWWRPTPTRCFRSRSCFKQKLPCLGLGHIIHEFWYNCIPFLCGINYSYH